MATRNASPESTPGSSYFWQQPNAQQQLTYGCRAIGDWLLTGTVGAMAGIDRDELTTDQPDQAHDGSASKEEEQFFSFLCEWHVAPETRQSQCEYLAVEWCHEGGLVHGHEPESAYIRNDM
ncbi:hypothetical protein B0T10DRAFT_456013 [Thelonectria olida]|uniref:Uncharacterized protein n=1 Tax=Thelonectria olida TaxID=1576542 RepID=A0A9P9AWG3_9HYPO|nr:hypothetical protein B0T10DRAFT_456013 [Thelonectria olida]